jgi:hypothetical protein
LSARGTSTLLNNALLSAHFPVSDQASGRVCMGDVSRLYGTECQPCGDWEIPEALPLHHPLVFCYDDPMRRMSPIVLFALLFFLGAGRVGQAQQTTGELDLTARITPTGGRAEPVRQFTLYVLTRSYSDITKDVESEDVIPSREKFIDDLKVSPELKEWLRGHEVLDLTSPNLDSLVTPDEIVHVPEFLLAYQRSNSGGVTSGIPKPKYADADKTKNPERYKKQYDEYIAALKKFIQAHSSTVSGMELELTGVNPETKWAKIQADHKKKVQSMAPEVAQTKYLVVQAETDLDGRASIAKIPAGQYWLSSLNLDADAGDKRLRWDVPVTVEGGRTTRVELTNLNAAARVAVP